MSDFPEGTILIGIRGVYDGWSVAKLPDGTLVNRWESDDYRYARTQAWIERKVADDQPRAVPLPPFGQMGVPEQ